MKSKPPQLATFFTRNHFWLVAQICHLLYRRIAFGRAPFNQAALGKECLADYKSAIQQIANLRYDLTAK